MANITDHHFKTMKNNSKSLDFKKLIRVLNWILVSFQKPGSVPMEALERFVQRLERIYVSRGIGFYINFSKSCRNSLMGHLSCNKDKNPLCRTTKDNIPLILGDLIPLVRRRSYLAIAMIYTVLYATRSLKIGKDPSLLSITQPRLRDVPDLSKHMSSF